MMLIERRCLLVLGVDQEGKHGRRWISCVACVRIYRSHLSRWTEQLPAPLERPSERRRGRGRIQDRFGDQPLILDGKPDKLRFLDRATRRVARGGHDKVRQAAPLDFGGAFKHRVNVNRQTRLQTSSRGGLFHIISIWHCAVHQLPRSPPGTKSLL